MEQFAKYWMKSKVLVELAKSLENLSSKYTLNIHGQFLMQVMQSKFLDYSIKTEKKSKDSAKKFDKTPN